MMKKSPLGLPEKFADAVGGVDGSDKLGVQRGVILDEFRDEPGARGLVRRRGNARVARGEKLLFLQLDALPRRVAENDIESSFARGG
jgi:hypothetical protein